MKRLYLTFLLLMFLWSAYGQTYNPLIRPNLYWDILHGDGTHICSLSGGNHYYFQGDTIILGQQYKIIRTNAIVQINVGPYCPPFAVDGSSNWIAGYIREDTIARKVFVYDQSNNTDVLLYDFTLTQGDTLNSVYAGQGFTLVIDSVRTTTLLNGAVRKIFYLHDNEFYIESVGGSQGLQFPIIQGNGFWEEPRCMKENSIQLFGSQCFGFVGIEELSNINSVKVFPNPTNNIINISGLPENYAEIFLTDIIGNEVMKKKYVNQLDLSNLAKGVYFLKIKYLSGEKVFKVVRE